MCKLCALSMRIKQPKKTSPTLSNTGKFSELIKHKVENKMGKQLKVITFNN